MIVCTWGGENGFIAGRPWQISCSGAVHWFHGIYYARALRSAPEDVKQVMLYNYRVKKYSGTRQYRKHESLLAWPFVDPHMGARLLKRGRFYFVNIRGKGGEEGYYLKTINLPKALEAVRLVTGVEISERYFEVMGKNVYIDNNPPPAKEVLQKIAAHAAGLTEIVSTLPPALSVRLFRAVSDINDIVDSTPSLDDFESDKIV